MIENALIALLGNERYIRFYSWLHDLNPMVGLVVVAVPVASIWALAFNPEKHVHDTYLNANVVFTNSNTSENGGFTFTAVVQVSQDETVTVRTKQLMVANQTIETACIERRKKEGGDVFYRLVGQSKCEALSGQ